MFGGISRAALDEEDACASSVPVGRGTLRAAEDAADHFLDRDFLNVDVTDG
jgi:hypothetical protein